MLQSTVISELPRGSSCRWVKGHLISRSGSVCLCPSNDSETCT